MQISNCFYCYNEVSPGSRTRREIISIKGMSQVALIYKELITPGYGSTSTATRCFTSPRVAKIDYAENGLDSCVASMKARTQETAFKTSKDYRNGGGTINSNPYDSDDTTGVVISVIPAPGEADPTDKGHFKYTHYKGDVATADSWDAWNKDNCLDSINAFCRGDGEIDKYSPMRVTQWPSETFEFPTAMTVFPLSAIRNVLANLVRRMYHSESLDQLEVFDELLTCRYLWPVESSPLDCLSMAVRNDNRGTEGLSVLLAFPDAFTVEAQTLLGKRNYTFKMPAVPGANIGSVHHVVRNVNPSTWEVSYGLWMDTHWWQGGAFWGVLTIVAITILAIAITVIVAYFTGGLGVHFVGAGLSAWSKVCAAAISVFGHSIWTWAAVGATSLGLLGITGYQLYCVCFCESDLHMINGEISQDEFQEFGWRTAIKRGKGIETLLYNRPAFDERIAGDFFKPVRESSGRVIIFDAQGMCGGAPAKVYADALYNETTMAQMQIFLLRNGADEWGVSDASLSPSGLPMITVSSFCTPCGYYLPFNRDDYSFARTGAPGLFYLKLLATHTSSETVFKMLEETLDLLFPDVQAAFVTDDDGMNIFNCTSDIQQDNVLTFLCLALALEEWRNEYERRLGVDEDQFIKDVTIQGPQGAAFCKFQDEPFVVWSSPLAGDADEAAVQVDELGGKYKFTYFPPLLVPYTNLNLDGYIELIRMMRNDYKTDRTALIFSEPKFWFNGKYQIASFTEEQVDTMIFKMLDPNQLNLSSKEVKERLGLMSEPRIVRDGVRKISYNKRTGTWSAFAKAYAIGLYNTAETLAMDAAVAVQRSGFDPTKDLTPKRGSPLLGLIATGAGVSAEIGGRLVQHRK